MGKTEEVASLDFKWLKKRGVGGKKKEIQFYESFIYEGVEYALYDCVYMYKEGLSEPYIGKLIKIWEHCGKTKKIKVHWFFRPGEISKWLGDAKTDDNEILIASGEGVGLANVNPLEAIAGKCNVVCVSNDCRNPKPSDEELKAAEYTFYRTFDVESCIISDKMDDKVGGLEIKYIFNRKEGETISTIPDLTFDKEEEIKNTVTCSEPRQLLTTNSSENPKIIKEDVNDNQLTVEVEANGQSHAKDVQKISRESTSDVKPIIDVDSNKLEANLEMGKSDLCLTNSNKDKIKLNKISSDQVEAKGRNKNPMDFDKLQDSKVNMSNSSKPPMQKKVELKRKNKIAMGSDGSNGVPSKKAKVDNSIELPKDNKSKHEEKIPLKALVNSGTNEEKSNRKNGRVLESDKGMNSAEVTGNLEGKILKKARTDGSLKLSDNINGNDGKDLIKTSEFSEDKSISEDKSKYRLALDSLATGKELIRERLDEKKRKLSMSKSPKVSDSSTDKDNKTSYKEFVVCPKPNADRNKWFKQRPWDERLQRAYEQGTAVLLHNLDPDYTSGEVEDIIWHAFTEYCEAKIVQRTSLNSPHCGLALIILKTKEVAQRVLKKLDEECLMLSNERPLVGTTCPPISSRKNSKFFGHLTVDKIKQNRELDDAVSTSHFSQPNTIEYEMAMEWVLLQSRSEKWWKMIYKQQGDELKKVQADLSRK